jgi:excisionase family DNA binding protein
LARPPEKEVLTVEDVAEWLDRHPRSLQQAARAGRIPARRIGKEWRFGRDHLIEHWSRRRGEPAPSGVPVFADPSSLGEPLGTAEAAELLSVGQRAIYTEVTAGRLPGWKVGGEWRFDRAELLRHLRGDPVAEAERYRRVRPGATT